MSDAAQEPVRVAAAAGYEPLVAAYLRGHLDGSRPFRHYRPPLTALEILLMALGVGVLCAGAYLWLEGEPFEVELPKGV